MFKQSISTKLALIGLLALAVFLGNLKFRQWKNEQAIESNIIALKQQQAERQQKSDELNQSLAYLSSNDFKEKVAREQLGFKKSGETVYGFSENKEVESESNKSVVEQESNPKQWWNYFFGDQ